MKRASWGSVVGSVVVFVACSSSGTSGSDATDGGTSSSSSSTSSGSSSGGYDAGTFALASLDDVCDGGPRGREVLTALGGSFAGTYEPPQGRTAPAPAWTGPTTPSALTMTIAYAGGAILCTPKHAFNCPPGAPCAAPPPATVSVELATTLETADGTFHESFVATATLGGGNNLPNYQATLPAAQLVGTYPVAADTRDKVKLMINLDVRSGGALDGNISEMTTMISFDGGRFSVTRTDGGA